MKKNRILGLVLFLLGALVILSPRYILPVCEFTKSGHQLSSCSYMARAEMTLGFLIASVSVAAFISKSAEALRWLMFIAFFISVAVLALPHILGYCASPQMPCNYGTVPMLRLLGGLILIISIIGFFSARERKA